MSRALEQAAPGVAVRRAAGRPGRRLDERMLGG
jgi:hypothetical protein